MKGLITILILVLTTFGCAKSNDGKTQPSPNEGKVVAKPLTTSSAAPGAATAQPIFDNLNKSEPGAQSVAATTDGKASSCGGAAGGCGGCSAAKKAAAAADSKASSCGGAAGGCGGCSAAKKAAATADGKASSCGGAAGGCGGCGGAKQAAANAVVPTAAKTQHFGAAFTVKDSQPLNDIIADATKFNGKLVKISGRVSKVCKKKGCWFTLASDKGDGQFVRVKMKDYGFFVPTDCDGKNAVVEGTFKVVMVQEPERKHLADDAGDDPNKVKGKAMELSMVATAIDING